MNLKVVKAKPIKPGNFVCSWCGDKFQTRHELLQHFLLNDKCGKNRNVSSQLSDKNFEVGQLEHPGGWTLDEVEAKRRRSSIKGLPRLR